MSIIGLLTLYLYLFFTLLITTLRVVVIVCFRLGNPVAARAHHRPAGQEQERGRCHGTGGIFGEKAPSFARDPLLLHERTPRQVRRGY